MGSLTMGKPRTKFDCWLESQYTCDQIRSSHDQIEPKKEKRFPRRDFNEVIKECQFVEDLGKTEPKVVTMSTSKAELIIDEDQRITENQASLQNKRVHRNNIWTYGVPVQDVPVYELETDPNVNDFPLGQKNLSKWHKIQREQAFENVKPSDTFKRKTFHTKPNGKPIDDIETLESKIHWLY